MAGRVSAAFAVATIAAALLCGGSARAVRLDMLAISPPADITTPATMVCGSTDCAQVTFTFTVTGGTPPYNLVCNLNSGDLFTVGSHVVSCLAQDSAGSSTPQASFTVTITPGGAPPPPPPPPATLAISAPADITAAATSPCGSTYCVPVSYSYTVTGGYPPYNLVCNLDSGNLFTVGAHVVSCLAQDSRGNSTPSATFTVTVTPPASAGGGSGGGTGGGSGSGGGGSGSGGSSGGGSSTPPAARDTTPPTIGAHANISLPATGPAGATVTYSVGATDPDDTASQIAISCLPRSGSTFTLGPRGSSKETTVTCHAHDRAGNSAASRSFTVTVLGAHDQLVGLERDVSDTRGLGNREKALLVSTVARASQQLASGATAAVRSELHTFVQLVRNLPNGLAQRHAVWISTASRIAAVTA